MSFLRAVSTLPLSRTSYRALTTSAVAHKSLTESVKETADAINKKVGQTLASGIESAEQATASAKQTATDNTPSQSEVESAAGKASQAAKETTESARLNANHAMGSAAGKVRDAKDELEKKV
ncbi:hypothetical protein IAU60_006207 [Kwoniella sp. DSM 27419]